LSFLKLWKIIYIQSFETSSKIFPLSSSFTKLGKHLVFLSSLTMETLISYLYKSLKWLIANWVTSSNLWVKEPSLFEICQIILNYFLWLAYFIKLLNIFSFTRNIPSIFGCLKFTTQIPVPSLNFYVFFPHLQPPIVKSTYNQANACLYVQANTYLWINIFTYKQLHLYEGIPLHIQIWGKIWDMIV